MNVRVPTDLKHLATRPRAEAGTAEADLCPGCIHGVSVAFRSRKPEWSCAKGVFSLSERRLSGPVTECGAFESIRRQ
ncbi:MAG: hypothetical protein KDH09_00315 [Chrysiogenetes bacterium]|nr:hypothetical protein [Chrysiogenetes bacterium]